MAGGKVSPRQKMVNLMYLVFIAMLAMNMSKQVLSAFGYMNEEIADTNTTAVKDISNSYTGLATKASDQPEKYKAKNKVAQEVKKLSDDFYNHLEQMKKDLTEGIEDPTNYESMDSEDVGNVYFFEGEGLTEKGQAYLDKINNYRTKVTALLGKEYPKIKTSVEKRFGTPDVETEDGGSQPWINSRYEGFPLISTITSLTQFQAKIKATENDMLSAIMVGELKAEASMKNYTAILVPDNPATLQGQNFKGKIVLGKYDATLKPHKVIVDGKEIKNIKNGAAILDFPAGSVGENEISGQFIFMEDGKEVPVPIKQTYAVVSKPSSAVISADKMNVVYRGVSNPITISVPGVPDNAVKASAPGLRKVSGVGKYMLSPGKGKEVKINVSAKLPDGTPINTPKSFRIKDIPAPAATARGQYFQATMPKTTLQKVTIGAILPDFVFDLKLKTTGFSISVPGKPTVKVRGNKLNGAAIRALNSARKGDVVTIFDVKASIIGNSGYYLKKVAPLSIKIK